ncbi:MAG: endonuclease III domain-containing protein, partial [Chloroflexota bacterium]
LKCQAVKRLEPMAEETTLATKERVLIIHETLLEHYGEPRRKKQRRPLDELVVTILSQNTADVNSSRAYESLRERFPDWERVLEADVNEVAEAIRVGGLANIKAGRIQRILERLQEERGELSLAFLDDMDVDEARDYLLSLHGVGPKTAACVLLFSLHKPAFPVDTHVHRVSQRLGLIPEDASRKKAHRLLEEMVPPEIYYPLHLNLIRHGRNLCAARAPQCHACPLAEDCDYIREHPERLESDSR